MHAPAMRRVALLLAPALIMLALLFGGGLGQALASSLEGGAWAGALGDPDFGPALRLTFRIALLTTLLSAAVAFVLALALRAVAERRGGRLARALLQVPLPVPHLVVAIGMLMLLSHSGLFARVLVALGFEAQAEAMPALVNDAFGVGIILSYVWKEAPFIAVLVLSALRGETRRLEEAARNLGAGRWRVLATITLPAAAPALAAGSLLVFSYVFGAFEVPQLLGQTRPQMLSVLAWRLYTDVDLTHRPQAMVVGLVITGCVVAVIAAASGARQLWKRYA